MQGKIYPLDHCSGAWETLLSQIIPAAIRTMPEIFLALILWNIRASKRIPAVNWLTRRRIVDSKDTVYQPFGPVAEKICNILIL